MNTNPQSPSEPPQKPVIVIPPQVEAGIAATEARQAADDTLGLKAAGAPLPGVMRDLFAPVSAIEVGGDSKKYKVRRFIDRDFIFLSQLGHPLNRFTAMSDKSYNFEPTGELCWQLCWLMTNEPAEVKKVLKEAGGVESAKELAADEFGELGLFALGKLMEAIAKQMTTYASAYVQMEAKKAEGENGPNPPAE